MLPLNISFTVINAWSRRALDSQQVANPYALDKHKVRRVYRRWFCVATLWAKLWSIFISNFIFPSWQSRKLWTKKLILQPFTLYAVLCKPAAYQPGVKFDCGICNLHHDSRSLWGCGGWWSLTMGKHRLLIFDASVGGCCESAATNAPVEDEAVETVLGMSQKHIFLPQSFSLLPTSLPPTSPPPIYIFPLLPTTSDFVLIPSQSSGAVGARVEFGSHWSESRIWEPLELEQSSGAVGAGAKPWQCLKRAHKFHCQSSDCQSSNRQNFETLQAGPKPGVWR